MLSAVKIFGDFPDVGAFLVFLPRSGLGVEFLQLSLLLASALLCLLRSGSLLQSEYVYSRCCSISASERTKS